MRALVEQADGYDVVLIASNKPSAAGLAWAEERGLRTWAFESKGTDKEMFDRRLSEALDALRHKLGMLNHIGRVRHHAGSDNFARREF